MCGPCPGSRGAAAHCARPRRRLRRGRTTATGSCLFRWALEPFDRDEAVDGFQDRLQLGRKIEIVLFMFRLRPDSKITAIIALSPSTSGSISSACSSIPPDAEMSLLRENKFVRFGEIEVGHAVLGIGCAAGPDRFHRRRDFRRKSARTQCCWCPHAASSSPRGRRRIRGMIVSQRLAYCSNIARLNGSSW